MRVEGIGRRAKVVKDLEKMAKNGDVPTFGQWREVRVMEKIFMGEIPGLKDNPRSKPLSGFEPVSQGNIQRVPSNAAIFKNWTNQGQIQNAPGRRRGIVKSPVDKANVFPSFFADVIDMSVPGEIAGDVDTEEFDRGNPLNHLVINAKLQVGKRIMFGRNDHKLSLASVSGEMVAGEPVVNDVYIILKTGDIIIFNERFIERGVVSIENQGTVEGEVGKTKIIDIDKKEKRAQD